MTCMESYRSHGSYATELFFVKKILLSTEEFYLQKVLGSFQNYHWFYTLSYTYVTFKGKISHRICYFEGRWCRMLIVAQIWDNVADCSELTKEVPGLHHPARISNVCTIFVRLTLYLRHLGWNIMLCFTVQNLYQKQCLEMTIESIKIWQNLIYFHILYISSLSLFKYDTITYGGGD